MRCPHCKTGVIEIGVDGHTYCPECMSRVENAEFSILAERIAEQLDEFFESVDVDDRGTALEWIQRWLDQKDEVF